MNGHTVKTLSNYETTTKVMNISNANIEGILNLSNYTELKELVCSNNLITEIINIPETLTYLNCENNKIEILTNLPNGMTGLNCKKIK